MTNTVLIHITVTIQILCCGFQTTSVKSRYNGTMETVQSAYNTSHSYVTSTYTSIQNRLTGARQTVTNTYDATWKRLEGPREQLNNVYASVSKRLEGPREQLNNVYASVSKRFEGRREQLNNVYTSTNARLLNARERLGTVYGESRTRLGGVYTEAVKRFDQFDAYFTDRMTAVYTTIATPVGRALTSTSNAVTSSRDRAAAAGKRVYGSFSTRFPNVAQRVNNVTDYATARLNTAAEKTQATMTHVGSMAYERGQQTATAAYDRATAAYGYGYDLALFVLAFPLRQLVGAGSRGYTYCRGHAYCLVCLIT